MKGIWTVKNSTVEVPKGFLIEQLEARPNLKDNLEKNKPVKQKPKVVDLQMIAARMWRFGSVDGCGGLVVLKDVVVW